MSARQNAGRWLNRLRFKTVWKSYMDNGMHYIEFRKRVFEMVNSIRNVIGYKPFSEDMLDKGWQWTTPGNENYKVAYEEMLTFICEGW